MILLYASPHEVKYISYQPMICIGVGATQLERYRCVIEKADEVILFGSCGYTGDERIDYGKLIELKEYIHVPEPVDSEWRDYYQVMGYLYVDMESYQVNKLCKELGVPFRSIRYVMDRCGRRCVLWGYNHFWRIRQHKKMQLKFVKEIL